MTLRISSVLLAAGFLLGAAGSVNAAEQVTIQSKSALEIKASSSEAKKEFRPKKTEKNLSQESAIATRIDRHHSIKK